MPLEERAIESVDHGVSILIVDDDETFQKAIRRFLSDDPTLKIVGVAYDGLEAQDKVQELKPDLVLMDALMPVMGGVEATRLITARFPGTIVIGLSSVDTHAMREAMLNAGAVELFGKIDVVKELIPAIQGYIAARNLRESKS